MQLRDLPDWKPAAALGGLGGVDKFGCPLSAAPTAGFMTELSWGADIDQFNRCVENRCKMKRWSDLSPTARAGIGIVALVAIPLWIGQAWLMGLFSLSTERSLDGISPAFEQTTNRDVESLSFCLGKNYSGRLALDHVRSPSSPTNALRYRNRSQHIVIDIFPSGDRTRVRLYKLNGRALAAIHRKAVQSCMPENRFPAAGDPRNRDFYAK